MLLLPALVATGLLILYPMYLVVMLSLREGKSMNFLDSSGLPLGLSHYRDVLSDPATWASAVTTLVYTAGSMGPAFVGGFAFALLLNERFPGRRWLRSLALLPWAVPGVLVSVLFLWLLDASYGIVNAALRDLGLISRDVAWFTDERTAMAAVIAPTIWKSMPFFTLTILAALQAVPEELYEAARMDGANRLQRLRFVTWPAVRGAAVLALVLNMLWAFREFDIIFATTGGGPYRATETLGIRAYQEAFSYFEIGRACVLGMVMLAFAMVLVLAARRPLQKEFF
ncbi:MAG: sugar ABC transporter permease [Burkholderiales bacterium]|nr:sugar ABC transporter permease [Burkholderiales bacterium]